MTETIEDMEKFVAERKAYFKENVFPITNRIASAIFNSRKLTNDLSWGIIKCNLVHNGVYISFRGHMNISRQNNTYDMTIKYGLFGFRKVLSYYYGAHHIPTPDIFHECEWMDKLDGLVEKIQREDTDWKKKKALKKYKKWCKGLSKKKCASLGS